MRSTHPYRAAIEPDDLHGSRYPAAVHVVLGKATVLGVNPGARGLLRVQVPWDPAPDVAWRTIFVKGPAGSMWPVSMHAPEVYGDHVILSPADDEVKRYVAALKERVDATNAQYAREVLPRRDTESVRGETDEAEAQRRIDAAQEILDEL